jgi:hypothetical protein
MNDTLKKIIKEITILAQERDSYREMFNMQIKLVGDLEVKRFELQKQIEEIQERIEKLESSKRYSSVPEMLLNTLETKDAHKIIISMFVQEIEQRAEEKMLKTGRLEGAHYAAMKQVAEEWATNTPPNLPQ